MLYALHTCMYAWVVEPFVSLSVCLSIYLPIRVTKYLSIYTYAHTAIRITYIRVYVYVHLSVYSYVHFLLIVYIHMYMCIQIHTYTYTLHVYMCIQKHYLVDRFRISVLKAGDLESETAGPARPGWGSPNLSIRKPGARSAPGTFFSSRFSD